MSSMTLPVYRTSVAILHDYCLTKKLVVKYSDEPTGNASLPPDQPLLFDQVHLEASEKNASEFGDRPGAPLVASDSPRLDEGDQQLNEQLRQLKLDEELLQLDELQLDQWLQQQQQPGRLAGRPWGGKKKQKQPIQLRVYEVKITVGDDVTGVTAKGLGTSKKLAKQAAATAALRLLLPNDTLDPATNGPLRIQPSSVGTAMELSSATDDPVDLCGLDGCNPVGALHQITHRLFLPPVKYEFVVDTPNPGPFRSRQHSCTASIYDLAITGVGTSKIKAKKAAALQLLRLLQDLPGGVVGAGITETVVKIKVMDEGGASLGDGSGKTSSKSSSGASVGSKRGVAPPVVALSADEAAAMDKFYARLRARAGKTLASLAHVALNRAHTNYCQMLCELGEEQGFDVAFHALMEVTDAGEQQCVVVLGCQPVVVCHAVGRSVDEARALAAHNALQYLRIMTKKPPPL